MIRQARGSCGPRHWSAAVLFTIALTGCGKANNTQAAAPERPEPVRVSVTRAVATEEPITLTTTGTFVAADTSVLTPAVEGLVVQTPATLGSWLPQGAPVVVLDQDAPRLRVREAEGREREASAALAQAEARLGQAAQGGENLDSVPDVQAALAGLEVARAEQRLAQTEETRSANLLKTGDASRASYDRAAAALRSAEARVASAQQQLAAARNTARQSTGAVEGARAALAALKAQTGLARKALADAVIRAPFAGYLTERTVAVGEYVTTASRLGRLERIQPIKVQMQAPEAEAARIRTGQTVRASVQAYGAESFEGKLSTVNVSLNAASRTMLVEATFVNADRRLRPGMFATATVELGGTEQRIIVPATAVQQDNRTDTFRAWVVEGSTARLRLVQPARKQGTTWVLVTGIKPDEQVVSGGSLGQLSDGCTVAVQGR